MRMLELDASLKPFWEPIVTHKDAIAELRKSYLAHLQQKGGFERQIADILYEQKYPEGHGDARFFAGCVWKYCHFVIVNFPKEWASVNRKYRTPNPSRRFTVIIRDEAHAESALEKAVAEASAELKTKGFRTS